MKLKLISLAIVLSALFAAPATISAQPGTRPWVFYGEEPWGGSYLGVDTEDVSSDRLGALHLKEETGVEVTMVDQDAPAGKAGLKEHDVILTINDQKVESVEQLRRLIREIPPGRTVSIGISRDGQPMTVKAQLAERNKMPDMNFNFNMPAVNVPAIHIPAFNMPEIDVPSIVVVHAPRSSGMMIENLTPQLGEFFGVKGGSGVLVRSVEKGSRAEQAGLRAGDVIVKIDGAAVNDCSDFSRLLRKRTSSKATITVLRDKREQTLTLTMPEPKRTGVVDQSEACDDLDGEAACAEIREEIASAMPAMTAELRRIQPEMHRMQKEIRENLQPQVQKIQRQVQAEVRSHQSEWKEQMRKMQKDLEKQKQELKQQMKQWEKEAEI
ncbi:MAG TPA: PDZ domain-containing protein [Terriglobales bacterium]